MYSFEPDEEQRMLVDSIKKYTMNDLRKISREAEEASRLPEWIIEKGWELGFLQSMIPEKYGGFGQRSVVTGVLILEEMAYGDLAGTMALMVPNLFSIPLLMAGNEHQKHFYLPGIVKEGWRPFTAAMIEPDFNFDANHLRTEVIREGESYIIRGKKIFVPFAKQSQAMIVYANYQNKTHAFIVPANTQGMTIGARQETMGIRALPLFSVTFDNARITLDNRLGGKEEFPFEELLSAHFLATAAMGIGLSRAAYEYGLAYAKEREAFGVKIAQKQAIAFMLAEMATEIEALRLLVWEAAWMLDQGKTDAAKHAYLAFQGCADLAMMVTDRAVQILGGHGYIRDHPVEKWLREGRGISNFIGLSIV